MGVSMTYSECTKGLRAVRKHVPHVLPIMGVWLDMIASGIKREEYRADKPYWQTRILGTWRNEGPLGTYLLRAGYGRDAKALLIDAMPIRRKGGLPEWGAEKSETYITLVIKKAWTITEDGTVTVLWEEAQDV